MSGGFEIRADPSRAPVLAPLVPAPGAAAEEIDRRSAAVGAPFAGGEIVLRQADEATIGALALALDGLGGRVLAMPGPAVPFPAFRALAVRTAHVLGLVSGDPSPLTALGVLSAIRGALGGEVSGRTVAVLGVGRVGGVLARLLADAGARVLASDLDPSRAAPFGALPPADLLRAPADVLSPNARGISIRPGDVPSLGCRFVAGGANGFLGPGAAEALGTAGIGLVPEEIAGSGWLLGLEAEYLEGRPEGARARMARIEAAARCWLSKRSG